MYSQCLREGDLIILISYAGEEDATAMDVGNNPRRIYAIVRLAKALETFEVKTVRAVPYQSVGGVSLLCMLP